MVQPCWGKRQAREVKGEVCSSTYLIPATDTLLVHTCNFTLCWWQPNSLTRSLSNASYSSLNRLSWTGQTSGDVNWDFLVMRSFWWGAGMSHWWDYLPPINVAWVRFQVPASWVPCFTASALSTTILDKTSWNKWIARIFHKCPDLQAGKNILSPFPPTQCCFLRFAIRQSLTTLKWGKGVAKLNYVS